jgi:hypothetical protein
MIELTPVVSSAVAAFGYEAISQTLAVRLTSGKVYQYKDVPPNVAAEFGAAESIGRAYGSMIRGKFEHSIVLDDEKAEES